MVFADINLCKDILQIYSSERYQRVKINTLKEGIFVEDIFAICNPFCKHLLC